MFKAPCKKQKYIPPSEDWRFCRTWRNGELVLCGGGEGTRRPTFIRLSSCVRTWDLPRRLFFPYEPSPLTNTRALKSDVKAYNCIIGVEIALVLHVPMTFGDNPL